MRVGDRSRGELRGGATASVGLGSESPISPFRRHKKLSISRPRLERASSHFLTQRCTDRTTRDHEYVTEPRIQANGNFFDSTAATAPWTTTLGESFHNVLPETSSSFEYCNVDSVLAPPECHHSPLFLPLFVLRFVRNLPLDPPSPFPPPHRTHNLFPPVPFTPPLLRPPIFLFKFLDSAKPPRKQRKGRTRMGIGRFEETRVDLD